MGESQTYEYEELLENLAPSSTIRTAERRGTPAAHSEPSRASIQQTKSLPRQLPRPAAEPERLPQEIEDEEDYFPVFFASLQAALLSILSQIATSVYFAMQYGASIELRVWRHVVPYIAVSVAGEEFRRIVMWSSIASAAILASFSLLAFVRRRRLQIKAGWLFAWLNIALIGVVNIVRVVFFEDYGFVETWMLALPLIGLVAFAVGAYIIWVDFDERRENLSP